MPNHIFVAKQQSFILNGNLSPATVQLDCPQASAVSGNLSRV